MDTYIHLYQRWLTPSKIYSGRGRGIRWKEEVITFSIHISKFIYIRGGILILSYTFSYYILFYILLLFYTYYHFYIIIIFLYYYYFLLLSLLFLC